MMMVQTRVVAVKITRSGQILLYIDVVPLGFPSRIEI